MKLKVIILLISLLSGSIEAQTIHYNAFSHNDYERPRPLFDAHKSASTQLNWNERASIMNVPVRYSMPFHSNSIVWKRIYG